MAASRNRSFAALIAGFVGVFLLTVGAIGATQAQRRALESVSHTLDVENRLMRVLTRLLDAETGQRGYLLTRSSEFLEPYKQAVGRLDGDVDALSAAIADNPRQRARLEQLRKVVSARQQLLGVSVALAQRHDPAAVDAQRLRNGKALMDRARGIVASMVAEEQSLLEERQAFSVQIARVITVGHSLLALVVLVLGVYAALESSRRIREYRRTARALADTNTLLLAEAASREQAEAQIRQMQKIEAIGQLTGGVAHDFNNMLAVIIGSLDMALRRMGSDLRRAEKSVENALEAAKRAAQLTAQLLAFSRQQPLAPIVLDINKVTANLSELLRHTLGESIRVETILAGGLWRVHADANQLENAILNLCVNGRDAMPDGGKLTIETGNGHLDDDYAAAHADVKPGQYVTLSVTDTGIGMSPEVMQRAFDPFYTTKGPGNGTGLGMSQTYGFVKQSGGHLKIYSELGVGTTVKIYLPRFYGSEQPDAQPCVTTEDLPLAKPDEIILVAEDDERVRQFTVDALRELGYSVVHTADGQQALAKIPELARLDLLFTDIVMPDMNGRQLADRARELRPDLEVLFTTGYTRNAVVHNGTLDAGVHFLANPFTVQQLAVKIREVLDAVGD